MSGRQLIIVDVETTSLDVETAAVVEVAAINTETGEELHFVPWHSHHAIECADPESLKVNRYHERELGAQALTWKETVEALWSLGEMLNGNTLGGSNPRFDARALELLLGAADVLSGWHHRLADISAMTAGAWNLAPTELPGLARCCELLGVENAEEHSALGDARAAVECFLALGALPRVAP